MSLNYLMHKHLDGQNVGELRNWKLNPVPADPTGADLVEGVIYYVEADKKFKYYDGTTLKVLGGEGGRKRGSFNASGGATPTAADVTVDVGAEIKDTDFFVVTVAGDLAGLPGDEHVEIGDLLYANVDNPAAPADWFAVQTNITLAENPLEAEVQTEVSVTAGTATSIVPNILAGISSVEIYDINGVRLTDSLAITLSLPDGPALTGSPAPYIEVAIESLVDISDLTVILSGW